MHPALRPLPGVRPRPARPRTTAARLARALAVCVLGYALIWLTTALSILGASAWARGHANAGRTLSGIQHFQQVDDRVYRGSAPREAGYRALAERGITTVVDLRAEHLTRRQLVLPEKAGLRVVRLPVRDGQTPKAAQVEQFLRTVRDAPGPVFVHCGAGVGRTGSMAAAYLVRTGQTDGDGALLRMVAVGPPSVEQMYYAATARPDRSAQPPGLVQALSRALDAPRRISHYF
ncbi:dual specificity protein phosphatase family protein [Streptomyces sp. NPDC051940]|uniref:protein-tyrosine phosphatase family protein n=1 Tax=Streptomyces sp. NPDC051940 TaxID=3155675 RepID=UPI00343DD240